MRLDATGVEQQLFEKHRKVAFAVLLRRTSNWRHGFIPIKFRERYGGEPSVGLGKFGDKAWELMAQLGRL